MTPWRPDKDKKEEKKSHIKDEERISFWKRHNWDKKVVRRCIILGVSSLVSIQLWSTCRYYYKGRIPETLNNPNLRYPYQLVCLFMAVSLILFLFSLRKLVPKSLRESIKMRFNRMVERYLRAPLQKLSQQLRRIFGLPDKQRVSGKDEKSFIFDLENTNLYRRFMSMKNQLRWKDLETNAEKMRFLYIKFVIKLIKTGYRYRPVTTVEELKAELALADDSERLCELYSGARYSGGIYEISDEDVEMSSKLIKKKGM